MHNTVNHFEWRGVAAANVHCKCSATSTKEARCRQAHGCAVRPGTNGIELFESTHRRKHLHSLECAMPLLDGPFRSGNVPERNVLGGEKQRRGCSKLRATSGLAAFMRDHQRAPECAR
jgi:hypothetical protein